MLIGCMFFISSNLSLALKRLISRMWLTSFQLFQSVLLIWWDPSSTKRNITSFLAVRTVVGTIIRIFKAQTYLELFFFVCLLSYCSWPVTETVSRRKCKNLCLKAPFIKVRLSSERCSHSTQHKWFLTLGLMSVGSLRHLQHSTANEVLIAFPFFLTALYSGWSISTAFPSKITKEMLMKPIKGFE